MHKRFYGTYYKHQSVDGYTIAVIDSHSNEGHLIQVIDNDKSYLVKDVSSVTISKEGISFDVHQDDLDIVGNIKYGEFLEPKKDVMSYYRYLPIECKHEINSMNHALSGHIEINNRHISFDNGNGYIEGDRGRNFPTKYVWINTSNKELSATIAVATIPLGLFTIIGVTSLIVHNNKEYRFGTYNFTKAVKVSRDEVILKKGKYILTVKVVEDFNGHPLKAPVKGDMIRYIHECPSLKTRISLKKKDNPIFDIDCPFTSFEYVWEWLTWYQNNIN